MYDGVELNAHALATLLDRRPLRRLPRAAEAVIAAAVGVLLAATLPATSFGRGTLLAAGAAAAWCLVSATVFRHDVLWPTAGPLLAVGMVWSGQTVAGAVEETRRRQWVQSLFGRYVSRQIVDHLLEEPAALRLGGTEQEVSVLFLDIRGFTAHSQGRSPSAVLAELNSFFGEIVPIIDRGEGLVLKYTGDGLLAVFGAPRALASHAQAAVEAAVEIVRASGRISAARTVQGGEPVRVGCAVHSGTVVSGNLGSAGRSEYTVIGDTVNVAARLEELNKMPELNTECASQLLVSQATYERLQHAPPLRGPFEFQIRGREGRIHVYQVRIPDGTK
jgi:adenylate cyclase